MIKKTFLILLAGLGVALAALAFWVNRPETLQHDLKPRLEAWLSERTRTRVTIDGEIRWHFWPLRLSIDELRAIDAGNHRHMLIGNTAMAVDLAALIRDPARWNIKEITLQTLSIAADDPAAEITRFEATTLHIDNLGPGQSARFSLDGRLFSPSFSDGVPFNIAATVRATPGTPWQVEVNAARITANHARATFDVQCNADITTERAAQDTEVKAADALLPLAWLRASTLTGQCTTATLIFGQLKAADTAIQFTGDTRTLVVHLTARELFEGVATGDLTVTLAPQPEWQLTTTLDRIQSAALLQALERTPALDAPVTIQLDLRATGNDHLAMQQSAAGLITLRAEPGTVRVTRLKEQLAQLAVRLDEEDASRDWPDPYPFQLLEGNWRINGERHSFEGNLDNLHVNGAGTIAATTAALNLDLIARFNRPGTHGTVGFTVNPLLYELDVPAECRGTADAPACTVDHSRSAAMLRNALSNRDSGLRQRLEEKIDEKVPEAYRDAARALLDLLGGGKQPAND